MTRRDSLSETKFLRGYLACPATLLSICFEWVDTDRRERSPLMQHGKFRAVEGGPRRGVPPVKTREGEIGGYIAEQHEAAFEPLTARRNSHCTLGKRQLRRAAVTSHSAHNMLALPCGSNAGVIDTPRSAIR